MLGRVPATAFELHGRMTTRGVWGWAALFALASTMGLDCARRPPGADTGGGDDAPGSGGSSGLAPVAPPGSSASTPAARTSGQAPGQGGSGGGASCPLDAPAKSTVRALLASAMDDALYVTHGTSGLGAGAERAYGASVPMTKAAARFSSTLASACTDATSPPERCEPAGGDAPVTRCAKLACAAPGTLVADVRIQPTPFSTALDPPPGDARVDVFDAEARFEETSNMLTLTQTSHALLTPAGGTALGSTATISATFMGATVGIGGGSGAGVDAASVSLHHEVDFPERSLTVVTDVALSGQKATGQLTIGNDVVGAFDEKGFDWVGACAP
jgi:hypothetical protein